MAWAIRIHETGGPEVLKYEEISLGSPGPGEVRLRHTAIGLNFIDTYFRSGLYPVPQGLPFIPGNEAAGIVVEVGEGVGDLKPGDRVAYGSSLGAYCTERIISAAVLVKLPETISDETAAAMMLKGMTARYLLRQTFKVKAGDTILVHAAAGGVGLILCQWAAHLGATVIGTVGSAEKAELARANGAAYTINYNEENFAERVKEITEGALCDVVYDGVGQATYPASLDCIKPRGLFASFGNASGAIQNFSLLALSQKGSLYATRPTLFTHISTRAALLENANDLFGAVGSGVVHIPVNQRFRLADAAEAHRALESRRTTGSTVLLP
ncbi:Quinone oxidoreductase 1 [Starkeya nomas]|uniref:Quinone oxidoreductase 1 n=2 Tax=Xanthobacteraceae TaxID=335928 RepID=A0A5S9NLM6_9HYPH|nr:MULTISPECIES: quinone oxidoreductase [Xanthobacteraceae]TSJ61529.1 quinone oxidoreductase [Ancylobacter moscoviensis]CAA0091597.1 Quinone oxidoreductase 1 [Starkeya nomas]